MSNTILFFNGSPQFEWANPETDFFLAHNDISSSDSFVSLSAPDVTPSGSCVSESANLIYAPCVLSEPVLESPKHETMQNG